MTHVYSLTIELFEGLVLIHYLNNFLFICRLDDKPVSGTDTPASAMKTTYTSIKHDRIAKDENVLDKGSASDGIEEKCYGAGDYVTTVSAQHQVCAICTLLWNSKM